MKNLGYIPPGEDVHSRKPHLTKAQADKLRRLIERYADARVSNSWKGGQYPDHVLSIEQELRKAQQDLENHIRKLEKP